MWLHHLDVWLIARVSQSSAVLSPSQAYRAAMQTQWSWILQLCSCVEQHLKDNALYFEVRFLGFNGFDLLWLVCFVIVSLCFSEQFFSDAKESMDYLKNLRDSIQRKYSCDQTSSLHRLEDLIQESMVSSQAFSLLPQTCNPYVVAL